ncbi:hypothetical protein RCL_jg22936.t1 [Rhizophagus clarus]|uniref:Uncharacterized protein n=1 Tax=Rhizophagus clarus TaxID=94130 RepID=A0A8H3L4T5_9GLOM|nr:hypothetical protein RCL_jg22936.t1 [Rhizophagus clarus]
MNYTSHCIKDYYILYNRFSERNLVLIAHLSVKKGKYYPFGAPGKLFKRMYQEEEEHIKKVGSDEESLQEELCFTNKSSSEEDLV